jgi:RNA recognition motif-containing protein
MAEFFHVDNEPQRISWDRKYYTTEADQVQALRGATTVYVGYLAYTTTEAQVHELFSSVGPVKKITMGENQITGKKCGFCFVEYYTSEAAFACVKYLNQTFLDERGVIKCDYDSGFKPGRQYGRGKSGAQVADDRREQSLDSAISKMRPMPLATPRDSRDDRLSGGKRGRDSDPYGRDSYGRDNYGRDNYGRDSYGRDSYGRESYGRDNQRENYGGRGGRDSFGGKKKICFAFQKGECTRGSDCRFAHETLQEKPDNTTTVKDPIDLLNTSLPASRSPRSEKGDNNNSNENENTKTSSDTITTVSNPEVKRERGDVEAETAVDSNTEANDTNEKPEDADDEPAPKKRRGRAAKTK